MVKSTNIPKIIPVILSGGAGARLWPLSCAENPKPFIKLMGDRSLIQLAFLRAASIGNCDEIVVVTNNRHFFKTASEFQDLELSGVNCTYLLEPEGRDTAAAVTIAALHISQTYGDNAVMLLFPADHLIKDTQAFGKAADQALTLALDGRIVTFGITPTYPETGYGYIEADGQDVVRFVEKPDLANAKAYLKSGRFFWNSGILCVSSGVMIATLEKHCPDVIEQCRSTLAAAATSQVPNGQQITLDADAFHLVPKLSIDIAVMEKAANVAIVPCDIGWSDIGSWNAIAELTPPDAHGNRVDGSAMMIETENCYIRSNGRSIGMVGVKDLIVVDTGDALLISHANKAQLVKQLSV